MNKARMTIILLYAVLIQGCGSVPMDLAFSKCYKKIKVITERESLQIDYPIDFTYIEAGRPENFVIDMQLNKYTWTAHCLYADYESATKIKSIARYLGATHVYQSKTAKNTNIYTNYFFVKNQSENEWLSTLSTLGEIIGINVIPIPSERKNSLRIRDGVEVRHVVRGTLADKAGLFPGDIITSINDKTVSARGDISTYLYRYTTTKSGDMEPYIYAKSSKLRTECGDTLDLCSTERKYEIVGYEYRKVIDAITTQKAPVRLKVITNAGERQEIDL